MERGHLLIPLTLAAALVACSDDTTTTDAAPDGGRDAAVDLPAPDTGPPPCGTGNRALPAGLTELKWDSGKATSSIRKQSWAITVNNKQVALNKVDLHEAVRFELAHPARIHGFAVQWDNIPASARPDTELTAGLYRDFGHNGFDFWEEEPLWRGTRCVEDVQPGKLIHYVFDKPVTIDHPGLVYVAHRARKPTDPTWMFDDKPAAKCDTFDACHSALNLPTTDAIATKGMNYNGVSFPFQQNFVVRLHVEYTRQIKPTERVFQRQTGVAKSRASVAWGDFDNDGWDDLLVGARLYRNDKGSFTDVTTASGIEALKTRASGGVWGDYDNDGCLDLFMFAEKADRADTLLRGDCKGGFTDVTATAGIVDTQSYNPCGKPGVNVNSPTAGAAWIDIDADGHLDLYLANFICWDNYTYYRDTVFHNKQDGTFEEWTGKHGFSLVETASRGASPADYDGDGDVDLFVHNYVLQGNLLYRNNGDGSVSESAQTVGVKGNPRFYAAYKYGHSIGSAWGDLDNDGDLDLVVGNLAHPRFWHFSDRTQLLINDGKGAFKDISGKHDKPHGNSSGLRYQETHSVPLLGDFDNDGNLDLVLTCVYDGRPTDFYWGQGNGTFKLDTYTTGISTDNGWGIAASDYDRDGDLDLFATHLFRNDHGGLAGRNWLQVRVVGGAKSNRAGIGAVVRVKAGSRTLVRHVQGGTGKGCQDSLYLHFGLGSAGSAGPIEVRFPGAGKVSYAGPFKAGQRVWLHEDGTTHTGWTPKP